MNDIPSASASQSAQPVISQSLVGLRVGNFYYSIRVLARDNVQTLKWLPTEGRYFVINPLPDNGYAHVTNCVTLLEERSRGVILTYLQDSTQYELNGKDGYYLQETFHSTRI